MNMLKGGKLNHYIANKILITFICNEVRNSWNQKVTEQ